MAARVVPLRRWVRLSLAASIPLGLAFLVLAVLGLTPPIAAVLAWAGLSLLAAAVAGLMLRDVGTLVRHVEASAGSEDMKRRAAPFRRGFSRANSRHRSSAWPGSAPRPGRSSPASGRSWSARSTPCPSPSSCWIPTAGSCAPTGRRHRCSTAR